MQHDCKTIRQLLCAGAALGIAGPASAAFIDDSKAAVELRNFYMNRDFAAASPLRPRPRNGPRASS